MFRSATLLWLSSPSFPDLAVLECVVLIVCIPVAEKGSDGVQIMNKVEDNKQKAELKRKRNKEDPQGLTVVTGPIVDTETLGDVRVIQIIPTKIDRK